MFVVDIKTEFYEKLFGKRLLVLVNHDVDAICSVRILIHLLEADNIQYTLIPVANSEDFRKAFTDHRNSTSHTLLLNFGSNFDVFDFLDCDDDQIIFILDNHRPVDVYNVYRTQVKLLMSVDDCKNIPPYEEVFRDSESEDDNEDDEPRLSLEKLEKRKERRLWKEKRLKTLFEYSQFSYYGDSVAFTLFNLAWTLSKDNKELLWLAMVGASDLHINYKIDPVKHEELIESLRSHLSRLSKAHPHFGPNAISIDFNKDLQLFLYRHWSLFESLRHTLHTCCKFKIWNVKGYKKMLEFLADVGIPLIQCKQKYCAMDLEFRKSVQDWIEALAEKYGLSNIVEESFIGNRGYKYRYNSNDVAFGVKALLESPSDELSHSSKFLKALDALSPKNIELLQNGIESAKLQLEAILKQVYAAVELKTITSGGPFLYVVIQESTTDSKLFSYPGCLLTLSKFLLYSHVAASKSRRVVNLPLVVITPDAYRADFALAAGIPPMAEKSPTNLFGKAFMQAAQMIKCEMEPDYYDSCVVRFMLEDKNRLIDALISLLS